MVSLNGFDASRVPLDRSGQSRELLPAGRYPAQIIAAEVRLSKTGNQYLSLTCCLMGDTYTGRQLRVACNLWHPNPVVKEIAAELLARLCLAVNVSKPNDTQELLFKPMTVHVEVEKRKDTGKEANVVRAFEPPGATGAHGDAPASGNAPPGPAGDSTAGPLPPPSVPAPVPPQLACKPVIPTSRISGDVAEAEEEPATPVPSPSDGAAETETVE